MQPLALIVIELAAALDRDDPAVCSAQLDALVAAVGEMAAAAIAERLLVEQRQAPPPAPPRRLLGPVIRVRCA